MQSLGDAKAGTYIGQDRMGNKYYEDLNEIPGRHRWVEFHQNGDVNASQVEPAWHSWLHHIQQEPPPTNPRMQNRPTWESVSLFRQSIKAGRQAGHMISRSLLY